MNRQRLYWDLETRPLPEAFLREHHLLPAFEPPGNVKDPEKIEVRRKEHDAKSLSEAALDTLTGEICAIGFALDDQDPEVIHVDDKVTEKALLQVFWRQVRNVDRNHGQLIGFNIKGFDLPFIYKRSWINRVRPVLLFTGKWWNDSVVCDLRDWWGLGDKFAKGNLDTIGRLLVGEGKTGSGKDFGKLLSEDPVKAKEYLAQDVRLLQKLHPILTMQPVKTGEGWE